jgi:hypothetical protein
VVKKAIQWPRGIIPHPLNRISSIPGIKFGHIEHFVYSHHPEWWVGLHFVTVENRRMCALCKHRFSFVKAGSVVADSSPGRGRFAGFSTENRING